MSEGMKEGIKPDEIDLSTDEMLKYYREFDPIEFKYGLDREETAKTAEEKEKWERYARIAEYESSLQFTNLTKKNYGDNYANLKLVYDQEEENREKLELMDLILNKIIGQYINIDGMERLFSETYIEFEWEMHLSADYKKHNMKFYRDHFFHQIRDAFMMDRFLGRLGFYEKIKKVLENEGESKISRYVHRCLVQQEYRDSDHYKELIKDTEDFYIRNLIYMASYMAALFHDIGYPEAYYMTTSRHIMDYIADLYTLNPGLSDSRRIYSLLQNSLLFRVVPFEKIEKRLNNTKKPEHGTLSAIVFLLHFYENGAIYRLPPYKSAAVELAAMAIFNHTNAYEILEKKDPDYYRPCFDMNPISYLLRICDDLQEWERVYFVISNKSNILFCNRCRTPIIRKKSIAEGDRYETAVYECNCKWRERHCDQSREQSICFSQAFDGQSRFPYRRIYNVSVCDRIHVTKLDNKLLLRLNYDGYKLLHIAYEDPTYAKFRIDELNHLKYLFEAQKDIPRIYLDYFVTSNPVLIKVELLRRYLLIHKAEIMDIKEIFYDGADREERFKKAIEQRMKACRRLFDDFSSHENLCRECSFCANFINALIRSAPGGEKADYSSCQNEVNIRCLSHLIRAGIDPAETSRGKLKESLPEKKGVRKLIDDRKLEYPDFQKLIEDCNGHKASIFYEETYKEMKEEGLELAERCPVLRLKEYMKRTFKQYVRLCVCQEISMENNREAIEGSDEFVKEQGRSMSKEYEMFPELQCLIEDCFLQFTRMYADISGRPFYPENYFKQFENGKRKESLFPAADKDSESEDYYYTALARYTDPERYVPLLRRKKDSYIDAFTDLYLFREMSRE